MIELPAGVTREPLARGRSYPTPAQWAALECTLLMWRRANPPAPEVSDVA